MYDKRLHVLSQYCPGRWNCTFI